MMNTFDVWSARTATPCQPVLVKVLRAAPPTLLRIKNKDLAPAPAIAPQRL